MKRFIALLAVSSLIFSSGMAMAQTTTTTRTAAASAAAAPAPAKAAPKQATAAAAAASANVTVNIAAPAKAPAPVKQKKAHVRAKPPALPSDTASLCLSGHTWKNWGAAPYAANRQEAMAKLGNALDNMVTCGLMPKVVADKFREDNFKMIRENPNGTAVGGKHLYLTPGIVLRGMMTGGAHPGLMLDVPVEKLPVGKGEVKAAESIVWAVTLGATTYTLGDPYTCHNWFLLTEERKAPPPPPVAQKQRDCYTIDTMVNGSRDDVAEHVTMWGPYAPSSCFAYRIVGVTGWMPLQSCPRDTCDNRNIAVELQGTYPQGMVLDFQGRISVPKECMNGCHIEVRVSAEFAESLFTVADFCLERTGNRGSCGTMVRHDDYHLDDIATIFYDRASIPATWPRYWRKLDWRFEANPKDCYNKFEK